MSAFRAVLVGLRHNLNFNYLLAPAALKAYAESRPGLAGRVKVEAFQRTVFDAPEGVAAEIAALRPGLAGFSCYLWNMERVLDCCRTLRQLAPEVKIALGGPEAAPQADRLLRENPCLDYVCLGEGEETFAELLRRLSSGASVEGTPGLAWRGPGGPAAGPERPPLADLGAVPSPLLLGQAPLAPGYNFILETSRGCPHKCAFCDWQNGRPVRYFPVERFLAEAAFLLDRFPKLLVTLADADIFLDLPRAKTLLRGLRPLVRGRNCLFTFLTRLSRLDDEALRLLDLPQFQLGAGVQSVNEAVLGAIARTGERRLEDEAEARLRRFAPRCRLALDLIYGLPGDDLPGFRRSLDWALARNPDVLSLQQALALPGAELGRRPADFGLAVEPRPPHRVLSSPSFPAADIEAAARLSFKVLALNEDKLFRWTAGRLAALTGGGRLETWELLAAAVEREAPEAGLSGLCGCVDTYRGDCDLVGVGWRRRLSLRAALGFWAALGRAATTELESRGPAGALPAFSREFRLRRARLFLERALSGPALEPWILRLDRLLRGRAGRLWQALKLFCRRALNPAGAGAA